MDVLPSAFAPLAAHAQFVTWFASPNPDRPGKFNKFPCDWRSGSVCGATNRDTWTYAATALAFASAYDRGHGAGAGFCFTADDPFFFLDIDGALGDDGQWSPLAQDLCARLAGAAVEVSHSGRGLHIIGRISRPLAHGCKNTALGLELYTADRFAALTGRGAIGDAGHDCTAALETVIAQYFSQGVETKAADWTTEPVAEWGGPTDDDELIRIALTAGAKNAAAAFGGKITFADLWTANADALARQWPGEGGKPYDASHADMALANHLAFWTGKNCERMEALMRRSALARDKWERHRTYLADTILKSCGFVQSVAKGSPRARETVTGTTATPQTRDPSKEFMGPQEQTAHFEGCYFVSDLARVFSLKRNSLLQKTSFDVIYGGHLFLIDHLGQKTTDSAWDAFTKSRVNIPAIADDLCFRPEIPSGAVIAEGNRTLVNSYVPYQCPAEPGDVGPFTRFLERLLPDETDRAILLNYMASFAQNPGAKFQWWPVLQGAEGNGKTLLLTALQHIAGEQYSHLPNAHAMARDGMKFNGWINRKLFIGIEEIALAKRRDFLDEFKIIVTNRRIPLEKKGIDQANADNRANGMLCTNHRDGVPITADQRRYAVFYTAQQSEADIERDGLTNAYFSDLYGWLRGENGYTTPGLHYIAHYLKNFPLTAELDPARLCTRPPKTSSTREAIQASLGRAEQEVQEAIEEGRPGFAGGWVSSKYLDALLDQIRAPVPRNKRRNLMQSLGYDWHPALNDGRVNEAVTPDAGKPKLYVRNGHLALNLTTPAEVARMYSKAQEPGAQNNYVDGFVKAK